jgi:hypothetical protein
MAPATLETTETASEEGLPDDDTSMPQASTPLDQSLEFPDWSGDISDLPAFAENISNLHDQTSSDDDDGV